MADFNALTGDLKTDNIIEMLKTIIIEQDIIKRMQVLDIILYMFDDKQKVDLKVNEYKKYKTAIFKDRELIQKIKFYINITNVPETALEYFGRDYATNPEYNYDPEFIEQYDNINAEINKFIGNIMNYLTKTDLEF